MTNNSFLTLRHRSGVRAVPDDLRDANERSQEFAKRGEMCRAPPILAAPSRGDRRGGPRRQRRRLTIGQDVVASSRDGVRAGRRRDPPPRRGQVAERISAAWAHFARASFDGAVRRELEAYRVAGKARRTFQPLSNRDTANAERLIRWLPTLSPPNRGNDSGGRSSPDRPPIFSCRLPTRPCHIFAACHILEP